MRSTKLASLLLWSICISPYPSMAVLTDTLESEIAPPNILVILVDDMGYGDLKCFNPDSKIATPNLNQLAKDGMRFVDAHAPGPLCHLSRYGLLTGVYPFRANVGQWRLRPVIRSGQTTIASFLKSNGYATAMIGKWHLGFHEKGYDQPMFGGPVDCGFDEFFGIRASTDIPPYFYIRGREVVEAPSQPITANRSAGWSPIQGAFWRKGKIAPSLQLENVLPDLTDAAIQVINNHVQKKSTKPLMLYLAYPAPHTPWLPSDKFLGQSNASMYGDFVMMVDNMIGKVLKAMESVGMDKNTMVVFTSDNGPVWYQKDIQQYSHDSSGGLRGMKGDAWEAGHRMPFIVRWPSVVKAGSVSEQLVCFTDFLATFSELLDVDIPQGAGVDSKSFLSALTDRNVPESKPRSEIVMASGNGTMMIRNGDWKMIEGLGSGGFSKPGRVPPREGQPLGQLYNLNDDLAETKNVYADNPQIVKQLNDRLNEIKQQEPTKIDAGKKNDRPNIVLLMTDDQGWGQTGYYDHPVLKTPNLDAMAAAGLRFDRFYAAAPVCSPTRAAVLTGRTNRRTGVELYGYALRRQETTIAQVLGASGYATGHFGKWHLNGLKGPGIPIFANDTHHPGRFGFETWLSVSNYFDRDPIMGRLGEIEEFKGDSSEVIVNEAVRFIKEQSKKNKPSFSVIWFGTPHGPFRADEEDCKDFKDLNTQSKNHYGELVAMDRSIGTLRQALRDLEIEENTLVWFTSDNGGLPRIKPDTVGGLRGNKGNLYEGGIRVPTIVEWPKTISSPRVTNFPAVSMDIVPTLAEATKASLNQMPKQIDGISLMPLFEKEIGKRETKIPFAFKGDLAVIDNQYKLIRKKNSKTGKTKSELYDLRADQNETKNLYSSLPKIAASLDTWLDEFKVSLDHSIAGKDYREGQLLPGDPEPTRWHTMPKFRKYFDQWKKRPEYSNLLGGKNQ